MRAIFAVHGSMRSNPGANTISTSLAFVRTPRITRPSLGCAFALQTGSDSAKTNTIARNRNHDINCRICATAVNLETRDLLFILTSYPDLRKNTAESFHYAAFRAGETLSLTRRYTAKQQKVLSRRDARSFHRTRTSDPQSIPAAQPRNPGVSSGYYFEGSVTFRTRSTATLWSVCTIPDGHQMVIDSASSSGPSPK